MQPVIPFVTGLYYHIHNRETKRTSIVIRDRNYACFMHLYTKYIAPVGDSFAYCLLRKNLHLLLSIRTADLPSCFNKSYYFT